MTRTPRLLTLVAAAAAAPLTGCMSLDGLLYNPEELQQYSLSGDVIPESAVELVSFPSGDLTLYGAWARQPTDAPTLVFFHGNAGHIDNYWAWVEDYWSWGYTVFTFDYRGFGRSEGQPSLDGLEMDGLAAMDHVIEVRGGDSLGVQYLGLSLGGAVAIRTARDHPPMSLITEDTFANLDVLTDASIGGLDVADGWFFNEDWDNAEALAEVEDVPTFIIHAREDSFIPAESADLLYAVAPDPREKWLVPRADHAEIREVAPAQYAEQVRGWATFAAEWRAEQLASDEAR